MLWVTNEGVASRQPEPEDAREAWTTGVSLVLQDARRPSPHPSRTCRQALLCTAPTDTRRGRWLVCRRDL